MPVSNANNLASLLRPAATLAKIATSSASGSTLNRFVHSSNTWSRSASSSSSPPSGAVDYLRDGERDYYHEDPEFLLSRDLSSILCDSDVVHPPQSQMTSGYSTSVNVYEAPWLSNISNSNVHMHKKQVSRERRRKFSKVGQDTSVDRLIALCADKHGADATVEVFTKLGRETGLIEYNTLIRSCIEKARMIDNEEESLKQLSNAYKFLRSMRDQGFQLCEDSYGQVLMYLTEVGMVPEFHFYCELIRDGNDDSIPNIAYYEMLLWIKTNNHDTLEEICYNLALYDGEDKHTFQETYLLAMCDGDYSKELFMQLVKTLDITKVTSMKSLTKIFKALGKLMLQNIAEKFFLDLKSTDIEGENILSFIFEYSTNVPNLAVEDVVRNFKVLHEDIDVTPTSVQYSRLIKLSCESCKVHTALDLVDQMHKQGLTLPMEAFHSILDACEESCEYNLVRRMHSIISCHDLKPNCETFRKMIILSVKMKDFAGAYNLISDLEKFKLTPTPGMYNAIMVGYFHEKNIHGGLMVLKQMEDAGVKPDSLTFSCLISHCNCEDDIIKCFKEMQFSGLPATTHVYMALINAYVSCGQFEKAKQVIFEKGIPIKNLNEVKSVLVSALAVHGHVSDALEMYEKIKQDKCNLEPRAVFSLIDHLQSDGELSRLIQLLDGLNDQDQWVRACFKVVAYCVRHEDLSSAIELLRKLKDVFSDDEMTLEFLFDEVFFRFVEKEPTTLHFGWNLLQAIKKDFGLRPSRKCLDFLLRACVSARDPLTCSKIWREYREAGIVYNSLSYLRMYQAVLALGSRKSAAKLLREIPKEDPHIRAVIHACQAAYGDSTTVGDKKNKKHVKSKHE
ncbi:unnamed protein product [Cuscuta epithymum]|uniref:PROP1-like PPR domain-containing protein n=2 Tax=Cuscuta epithymum TaxID=186058 RepID=A0AAV0FJD1_9ASTE|nr:unnamed protein product [Cuscuta epithymum]